MGNRVQMGLIWYSVIKKEGKKVDLYFLSFFYDHPV